MGAVGRRPYGTGYSDRPSGTARLCLAEPSRQVRPQDGEGRRQNEHLSVANREEQARNGAVQRQSHEVLVGQYGVQLVPRIVGTEVWVIPAKQQRELDCQQLHDERPLQQEGEQLQPVHQQGESVAVQR